MANDYRDVHARMRNLQAGIQLLEQKTGTLMELVDETEARLSSVKLTEDSTSGVKATEAPLNLVETSTSDGRRVLRLMNNQELAKKLHEEYSDIFEKMKDPNRDRNQMYPITHVVSDEKFVFKRLGQLQKEISRRQEGLHAMNVQVGEGSGSGSGRKKEKVKKEDDNDKFADQLKKLGEDMREISMKEKGKIDHPRALVNWIRWSNKPKKQLKAVRAINNEAAEIGNQFSRFLVDFLQLFSEWKDAMARYNEFKHLLQATAQDMNPVAIRTILFVLDLAEAEIKKARTLKIIFDSDNEDDDEEDSDPTFEPRIDKFLGDMFEGIMLLETILGCEGLPDPKVKRNEELSRMGEKLRKCEALSKVCKKRIDIMMMKHGSIAEDARVREYLTTLKDNGINGLWQHLKDPDN